MLYSLWYYVGWVVVVSHIKCKERQYIEYLSNSFCIIYLCQKAYEFLLYQCYMYILYAYLKYMVWYGCILFLHIYVYKVVECLLKMFFIFPYPLHFIWQQQTFYQNCVTFHYICSTCTTYTLYIKPLHMTIIHNIAYTYINKYILYSKFSRDR